MSRWAARFWNVVALSLLTAFLICALLGRVRAHEHVEGETSEQARVVDFLQKWHRPKGNFPGIDHRIPLCCYSSGHQQDCFAIKAVRVVNGVREVYPETEGHTDYEHWYPTNTGVDEDLQSDPEESPDGRSYVCIVGGQVACLVWGSGV